MDYSAENMKQEAQPKRNAGGGVLAALGGGAVGAGAMIATVNRSIRNNLMKPFNKTHASIDKYAAALQQDMPAYSDNIPLADLNIKASRLFKNGMVARVEDGDLREALSDRTSTISEALLAAKRKNQPSKTLENEIEHIIFNGNSSAAVDVRDQVAQLIVESEKELTRKAIMDVPSHIPLGDRFKLSKDLYFTGKQHAGAALAFGGAALVAAGAIHLGMKSHANNRSQNKPTHQGETGSDMSF